MFSATELRQLSNLFSNMEEINLKNYEFERYLLDNVKLFDEVLDELDEPPLFENPNFRVFSGITSFERYLVMETTNQKPNTLPVMIWFEMDDLIIDIAGMRETFEWSKGQISKDRNSVIELIRNLFTGFVLIDDKNSSKFIQVFDSNGDFVNCQPRNNLFHMITGRFLFRFKDIRKLYLPLFTKK